MCPSINALAQDHPRQFFAQPVNVSCQLSFPGGTQLADILFKL